MYLHSWFESGSEPHLYLVLLISVWTQNIYFILWITEMPLYSLPPSVQALAVKGFLLFVVGYYFFFTYPHCYFVKCVLQVLFSATIRHSRFMLNIVCTGPKISSFPSQAGWFKIQQSGSLLQGLHGWQSKEVFGTLERWFSS